MPLTTTADGDQRNPLPDPWVYRSLSITLSVFRVVIQVAIPNFAGYIRSAPAPQVIFLPNGFGVCSFCIIFGLMCCSKSLKMVVRMPVISYGGWRKVKVKLYLIHKLLPYHYHTRYKKNLKVQTGHLFGACYINCEYHAVLCFCSRNYFMYFFVYFTVFKDEGKHDYMVPS